MERYDPVFAMLLNVFLFGACAAVVGLLACAFLC